MIRMRNTLVAVRLDESTERKAGAIVVSTNSDLFKEGTVVAVGPGNIQSTGGVPETHDLHPGDRVLVKYQDVRQSGQGYMKNKTGTEYTQDGEKVTIFEQMFIIAVLPPVPSDELRPTNN